MRDRKDWRGNKALVGASAENFLEAHMSVKTEWPRGPLIFSHLGFTMGSTTRLEFTTELAGRRSQIASA